MPTNDEWTPKVSKLLMQVGIANLNAIKEVSFWMASLRQGDV